MIEMGEELKDELASKISNRIGVVLDAKNIHYIQADGTGYHYYIQCLKPNYPVLMADYKGQLILVLPFEDYKLLCDEKIVVDDYIESAYFNYGYYRGGGGLISGAYWQPLEEGPGIHDTESISQYLNLLHCRMAQWMSVRISEECCAHCSLASASCQYSPLGKDTREEYQLNEPDSRPKLFAVIKARVEAELNFQVSQYFSHDGDRNELRLFPGNKLDTVTLGVSARLLNDLLYHPNRDYDWQQLAQNLVMSTTKGDPSEYGKWEEWKVILSPSNQHKREVCLDLWRKKVAQWGEHNAALANADRAEQNTAIAELLAPSGPVSPRPSRASMKFCGNGKLGHRKGIFNRTK